MQSTDPGDVSTAKSVKIDEDSVEEPPFSPGSADAVCTGGFPAPTHTFEQIEELVWDLVREWYDVGAPTLAKIQSLPSSTFARLWTNLWFAKGTLQHEIDTQLHKYAPLLGLANHVHYHRDGCPELSAKAALLWKVGWMLAFDQVSRNVFRGTSRAYATDAAAFQIAQSLLADSWPLLPTPIQVSVTLVYIHSENMTSFAMVHSDLLPRLQPDMSIRHPGVWESLTGVATNHRDRMLAFGRIPERNKLLNRESTPEEQAWMSAIRPI